MKNYFLSIALCTFMVPNAQTQLETPWMKELKESDRSQLTFNDIIDAGNAYWKSHDKDAKGSGYKPFKRWEAQWEIMLMLWVFCHRCRICGVYGNKKRLKNNFGLQILHQWSTKVIGILWVPWIL